MAFLVLFLARAVGAAEVKWEPLEAANTGSGIKVTGRIVASEGGMKIEPARVQGRVLEILRREGEKVAVGTPLFDVNSAECNSLVEEKRVAENRNLPELVDSIRLRQKQLALDIAGGHCRVLSSYAGTIVKRNVEVGAAFNAGDNLLTILDTRNLVAELDIPERLLGQVRNGQPVTFSLASNPGASFKSRIAHILPTVDTTTRTSKARLETVKLPPRSTIEALVFAEIEGGSEKGLLRTPTGAFVFRHNRQYVVKKAEPNPIAVQVEVVDESESRSAIRPTVANALQAGDMVATKGAIFLFNKLVENGNIP